MEKRIIRIGLLNGIASYILIVILFFWNTEIGATPVVMLAGCEFVVLLAYHSSGKPDSKLTLFIFSASLLYLICVWLSLYLGYFSGFLIVIVSIAGAAGLFFLYHFLVDSACQLWRGLKFMLIFGFCSSICQALALSVFRISPERSNFLIIASITPIWEPLFILGLIKSKLSVK